MSREPNPARGVGQDVRDARRALGWSQARACQPSPCFSTDHRPCRDWREHLHRDVGKGRQGARKASAHLRPTLTPSGAPTTHENPRGDLTGRLGGSRSLLRLLSIITLCWLRARHLAIIRALSFTFTFLRRCELRINRSVMNLDGLSIRQSKQHCSHPLSMSRCCYRGHESYSWWSCWPR